MEGLSFWSAQALQNLDCNGPLRVIYYQNSHDVLNAFERVSDEPAPRADSIAEVYLNNLEFPRDYKSTTEPEKLKASDSIAAAKAKGTEELNAPERRAPRKDGKKGGEGGGGKDYNKEKKGEGGGKDDKKKKKGGGGNVYSKEKPSTSLSKDLDNLKGIIFEIHTFLNKMYPRWIKHEKFLERLMQLSPSTRVSNKHQPSSTPNPEGGDPYGSGLQEQETDSSYYKYALVFGDTTKFNPSGIWVVEEFYNNDDK